MDQRSAGRGICPVPSRPAPSCPGRDGTRKLRSRAGRDRTGQFQKIRGTGRERKILRAGRDYHQAIFVCPVCPAMKKNSNLEQNDIHRMTKRSSLNENEYLSTMLCHMNRVYS